ncbi:hypothetical protein PsorP6_016150 [Peronosclerospora sorghi]|uniref:Uncharacterized protein n=1 Tax=Peronosclerospora sorghi TaxID=230839 RepID=A0ACC0VQ14_9STRA|nr:hypothetical protein PsorP6_016150 [Peronosclerospora sorghi]
MPAVDSESGRDGEPHLHDGESAGEDQQSDGSKSTTGVCGSVCDSMDMDNLGENQRGVPVEIDGPVATLEPDIDEFMEQARVLKRDGFMSSLLASLKLSKHAALFEAEEIYIESLCLMNAGHLRDLGIPFGPRIKILNAAACLADFYEDEDDERQSMESTLVTTVARFKQKRAEMKHFRAGLVRRVPQWAVRIAILTTEGEICNVGSGIIIH